MKFGIVLILIIFLSGCCENVMNPHFSGRITAKQFNVGVHNSHYKLTLANKYSQRRVEVPSYIYQRVEVGDYFQCSPEVCDDLTQTPDPARVRRNQGEVWRPCVNLCPSPCTRHNRRTPGGDRSAERFSRKEQSD